MDTNEDEPRISMVVGVFATMFFLLVDAISLIPGVGDIESLLSTAGIVIGLVSNVGATIISTWSIVTVAKFIPGLQEVPLWTPAWWFVWYAENHPSSVANVALQTAQEAAAAEEVTAGALEEGGAAGAASVAEGTEAAGEMAEMENAGAAFGAEGDYAEGTAEAGGNIEGGEEEPGRRRRENASEEESDLPDFDNGDRDEDEEKQEEARDALIPNAERDPTLVAGEELDMPSMDFGDWNGKTNGKTDQDEDDGEYAKAA